MGLTPHTGLAAVYRIELGGKDLTESFRRERRLLEIEVEDQEGEASDSVSLTLDDRAPHIAWPPEGATLRLWLGNSSDDVVDMGLFTIDAPESSGPPERLTVRGHGANFLAEGTGMPLQTQRSRTWATVSLADMANAIAVDHSLIARVQPSVAGAVIDPCEQYMESDIAFLTRIAKENGARVRVKGIHSTTSRALEVVAAGALLPQIVLAKSDVERWSLPLGNKQKPGTVVAAWQNPKTGASGIQKAGNKHPVVGLHEIYDTARAALSAAKCKLKDRDRAAAQLTIDLTTLRPSVASGTPLAMSGFRTEIDTIWNAVTVRHHVSAGRARTSIVAERAI